jgi:hypothetical protein
MIIVELVTDFIASLLAVVLPLLAILDAIGTVGRYRTITGKLAWPFANSWAIVDSGPIVDSGSIVDSRSIVDAGPIINTWPIADAARALGG